jgi:hypothetical protein
MIYALATEITSDIPGDNVFFMLCMIWNILLLDLDTSTDLGTMSCPQAMMESDRLNLARWQMVFLPSINDPTWQREHKYSPCNGK